MLRNRRDSVLPPARLYRAELEWLKSQANQRNISFSVLEAPPVAPGEVAPC
jgi:hypothetical protein